MHSLTMLKQRNAYSRDGEAPHFVSRPSRPGASSHTSPPPGCQPYGVMEDERKPMDEESKPNTDQKFFRTSACQIPSTLDGLFEEQEVPTAPTSETPGRGVSDTDTPEQRTASPIRSRALVPTPLDWAAPSSGRDAEKLSEREQFGTNALTMKMPLLDCDASTKKPLSLKDELAAKLRAMQDRRKRSFNGPDIC